MQAYLGEVKDAHARALGAAARRRRGAQVTLRFQLDVAGSASKVSIVKARGQRARRERRRRAALRRRRSRRCPTRCAAWRRVPIVGDVQQPRWRLGCSSSRRARCARRYRARARRGADAAGQGSCPPVELIYDENEQIAESRKDTNEDCRLDEIVYYIDGVAERAERDTDFDGRVDVWIFFEEDGKTPARQDQDTNGDGQKDRWIDAPRRQARATSSTTGTATASPTRRCTSAATRPRSSRRTPTSTASPTAGRATRAASVERSRWTRIATRRSTRARSSTRRAASCARSRTPTATASFEIAIFYEDGKRAPRRGGHRTATASADVVTHFASDGETIVRREADTDERRPLRQRGAVREGRASARQQRRRGRRTASLELVILLDARGPQGARGDRREPGRPRRAARASTSTACACARRRTRPATASPRSITSFDGDTLLRREADTDRDGRMDTTVTFRDGRKASQEEDRNGDGEVDASYRFDAEERVVRGGARRGPRRPLRDPATSTRTASSRAAR